MKKTNLYFRYSQWCQHWSLSHSEHVITLQITETDCPPTCSTTFHPPYRKYCFIHVSFSNTCWDLIRPLASVNPPHLWYSFLRLCHFSNVSHYPRRTRKMRIFFDRLCILLVLRGRVKLLRVVDCGFSVWQMGMFMNLFELRQQHSGGTTKV